MNSVIEKLAEVEETAEAIVEHARQQKSKVAAGSRESSGPGTEEEPDCN